MKVVFDNQRWSNIPKTRKPLRKHNTLFSPSPQQMPIHYVGQPPWPPTDWIDKPSYENPGILIGRVNAGLVTSALTLNEEKFIGKYVTKYQVTIPEMLRFSKYDITSEEDFVALGESCRATKAFLLLGRKHNGKADEKTENLRSFHLVAVTISYTFAIPDIPLSQSVYAGYLSLFVGIGWSVPQQHVEGRDVLCKLHESIYQSVLEQLIGVYKQVQMGDPLEKGTLLGPLHTSVSKEKFEKGMEIIKTQVYKALLEKTKSLPAKVENNRFCVSVHFKCVDEKAHNE
ncbi:hypothetical protein IFM89_006864 [Coptis chinensis]|uniref:Aldehyde dehydrogenase domain-containing protein n=1 Tax=Coptis chinensis TaxID=261450 RepID=A0A835GWV7_9MAGN|nr:hypothetical protein IFM89_006864 [Coptis chinensis]